MFRLNRRPESRVVDHEHVVPEHGAAPVQVVAIYYSFRDGQVSRLDLVPG